MDIFFFQAIDQDIKFKIEKRNKSPKKKEGGEERRKKKVEIKMITQLCN